MSQQSACLGDDAQSCYYLRMNRLLALPLLVLLPGLLLAETPKVAWYGTLQAARAEASRTGKPILLQSAAPHCHDVPGIW